MKDELYERIAKSIKPKENKIKNIILAFISGGLLGFLAELIIEVLCLYHFSRSNAGTIMIVIFIFIASLFTALGFFDNLVSKFKCGLIIPITGFAHSMTSAALDYKNEGPISGRGSNIFILAGSVLLYGVTSAWLFGLIRYIIGGIK